MENWRPPLHVFLSICTITLIAASMFDGNIVQCDLQPSAQYSKPTLRFSHTAISLVPTSMLNAFSMPKYYTSYSYEFFSAEAVSNDLILHAKLSFIFELIAGFLVLFTIIGALATTSSFTKSIKPMAAVAAASLLIAAIFNTILASDARKVDGADLALFVDTNGDIGTCAMGTAGIYAWTAAGLWLVICFDGWRSMRKM